MGDNDDKRNKNEEIWVVVPLDTSALALDEDKGIGR